MKKISFFLSITSFLTSISMLGMVVGAFSIIQINNSLPDAQSIRDIELKVPLRVYSSDNLLISEFGNERRKPIAIEETPQILIDAIIAGEDDNFYSHHGIDFLGVIRSAITNYRTGSRQGASTLTMQVARNFFLTPEQTYTRKIREALLSVKLEQVLTKDEILSLYINKMFLGHRSYGFGAAADVYYGKELSELSIAETAVLAGLLKAPSTNNPLRSPTRALQRRNYILGRLLELEKISQADYETALAQPSTAKQHSRGIQLSAPHIAEMVRAHLIEELGEDAYWQGLNVYTTIESDKQQVAQQALRVGLKSYDQRHGFRGPINHVDLKSLIEDNSANEEQRLLAYSDAISDFPNSHEQIPALVISSNTDNSELYTNTYGIVNLLIENAKWARPYKTANLRGEPPTAMDKLLSPGDIVYIEPTELSANDENSQQQDVEIDPVEMGKNITWRLSQIPNISGSLISMDPTNGRIISLVGGYDFFLNKYNRAIQSIRQPGSNIKPFIYSASLDRGYTPASLISGAPIVLKDPTNGTVWRPENYSGDFFGPTRMRTALAKSMNLVSIRLLRAIGIPYAREYAERFGLNMSRFSPTLTMALGSGGVTPIELITAYSTIANSGYKIEPYFIDYITDKAGNIIYQAKQPDYCDECYLDYLEKYIFVETDESEGMPESANQEVANDPKKVPEQVNPDDADMKPQTLSYVAPRVMSRANNFLTVSMLKDVVKSGTARKALALNRQDLAGKTGTTNDYVDAWFSGFNSKVVTTVWVGFDEPKSMGRGEAGSVAALPIWLDYMRTGLKGIEEDPEELPDYIEQGYVNAVSGQRTDEFDPNSVPEYFLIESLNPDILEEPVTNTNDPYFNQDDNDNFENYETEQPAIDPQSRIIDSREDTDGLF